MSILVRNGDALKSVAAISLRRTGGTIKSAASVWMRTAAGQLKLIWTSFSVSLSTNYAFGSASSYLKTLVTSAPVTVYVTGGVAPYTYLWSRTDSLPIDVNILGGATATASFSAMLEPDLEILPTFRCTVTDASGATMNTAEVEADLSNRYSI